MDKNPKIIVSLTAIPPRFNDVGFTLDSILKQNPRPDAVELVIPKSYRRFPDHAFCLPEVPDGVDVVVAEQDLGPASKVLDTARKYRGQNARIIYCDDDRIAPRNWLKKLVEISRQRPDCAVTGSGTGLDRLGCNEAREDQRSPMPLRRRSRTDLGYRWRRIKQIAREQIEGKKLPKPGRNPFKSAGYIDIAEGMGGVSVSPDFFDDLCFDIPPILWTVDDIWLSGSMERKGIPIWAEPSLKAPSEHRGGDFEPLYASVIENTNRYDANLACIRYMQKTHGIWK